MNPITEDDIASYLLNTPDFFERHAAMLASVQLSSPHSQRAVSLQERQAEMLREKIKTLEHRVMDMVRHGNENMVIAERLQRWTRSLLLTPGARALPAQVVAELKHQFLIPQAALKLWDVGNGYADEPFARGVSSDVKAFASSLARPYCGVNSDFEAAGWLEDPAAAKSLALLPLRALADASVGGENLDNAAPGPAFGLLVLASPDPQRFHDGMGTDFLERIAELSSAALSRLR